MGENTGIPYATHTFNPWIGCTKVSPGCLHCYAERDAERYGFHGMWGMDSTRKMMSEAYWSAPLLWNDRAQKDGLDLRVLCGSMCDVFDEHPKTQKVRERLWDLVEKTPWLTWMFLTKRPQNIGGFLPESWVKEQAVPDNTWWGFTAENQDAFDSRSVYILDFINRFSPPIVFVSVEPMLGFVDMTHMLVSMSEIPHYGEVTREMALDAGDPSLQGTLINMGTEEVYEPDPKIDWVICGSESGSNRRPVKDEWLQHIVHQCQEVRIPLYLKQWVDSQGKLVKCPEYAGQKWLEIPGVL